jgi:membrane protease YdiL (CAAX protease family)
MKEHSVQTGFCRDCGVALPGDQRSQQLCSSCEAKHAASQAGFENAELSTGTDSAQVPPSTLRMVEQGSLAATLDPDNPHWGIGVGVGVWVFSIASMFVFQILTIFVWAAVENMRGGPMPTATQEDVNALLANPSVVLASVVAIIFAHLLTLAVCWAVVTGFGRRPFLESLGWHWAGISLPKRILLVVGVMIGMIVILITLTKVLPDTQVSPFAQMLKTSRAVRVVIVALAVITAPLVEEVVYRGVLYSALRKRLGVGAAVATVSLLFPLVHVPQYTGAWAGIIGLTLLSLILTVIRARMRSLLPCVVIHLVFNAVMSLEILRQ